MYKLEAAAGCSKGLRRGNNEDNLYFDGIVLNEEHEGLSHALIRVFSDEENVFLSVFDGMGGEEAGETASYRAALAAKEYFREGRILPADKKGMLQELSSEMNRAVCAAAEEAVTGRMGSTAVSFFFRKNEVFVMNLGDSRAYRFRDGTFLKISRDHLERLPEGSRRKPGLTQFLGIFPEELRIEPFIAKGEVLKGDAYLLCSDGLTDMLTEEEICSVVASCPDTAACVDRLIEKANEKGGRDNITAILCRIV